MLQHEAHRSKRLVDRPFAITLIAVGSIAMAMTGCLGALWVLPSGNHFAMREAFEPMTFDAEVWKATPPDGTWGSVRLRMIDDFLSTHDPIGRTWPDVESDLGPPDGEGQLGARYVYRLGRNRDAWSGVSDEWLLIRTDSNSVVRQAWIHQ